jgi:hypothetical protein
MSSLVPTYARKVRVLLSQEPVDNMQALAVKADSFMALLK